MKSQNWLAIGGVALAGAIAYVIYKGAKGVGSGFSETTDRLIAAPIANAIIGLTLPGDVELRGMVQLPDGTQFPLNNIRLGTDLSFVYSGTRYRIANRVDNTYFAVR